MLVLWPLLLPFAALSGWYIGQKKSKKQAVQDKPTSHDYVRGVNYILNEQPDKAIDIFIKMLEVDEETVETHLALGGLFRRRGEVDRAIRIHQNLIARPQLTHIQRVDALMALGTDYMCAGVYDRAERIFKEVTELGGNAQQESFKNLFSIYQQQKSWQLALGVLKKLQKITNGAFITEEAHCYCEQVELYIQQNNYYLAQQTLKQATNADKSLVRVSILQGRLEALLGNHKQAIKAYKKVVEQDPVFISEIIEPLFNSYQQLDAIYQFEVYMRLLLKTYPSTTIIFCIAKQIKRESGDEQAIDFVTEQLGKHPSLKGLRQLIDWHLTLAYGKVRAKLSMLHDITAKLLEGKPTYRCESCGFAGNRLNWHCPSCKRWSTTKPICGIEGE